MNALLDSPLYCRFNGFALGAFLGGANFEIAAPRYGAMRRRMQEFLLEIGVQAALPPRHAAYRAGYGSLFTTLKAQLHARSPLLHDFMGIGAMAVLYAGNRSQLGRAQRQLLRERWVPALDRHGLTPQVYDRFVRDIGRSAPSRDASVLLSHAFGLVTELLQPLAPESDICFVAMPFGKPFGGYFGSYYRPALARAGFRAIRAWGGISSEEYYSFVGPLLNRCGAVFADLSTLNLNVINEVGLAHGGNRPTFLVMRPQRREPPSNIAQLPILEYADTPADWQRQAVPQLARFIRWIWKDYTASLTEERVIVDTALQLIRYLRSASRPVPPALASLAEPGIQDTVLTLRGGRAARPSRRPPSASRETP